MCYTYDSLGRVTSRTVKKISTDEVLSTENFTYDAAGNVTGAPDSAFRYDTNNRLIEFNGNTVSYDLDGNMLSNGGFKTQIALDDEEYTFIKAESYEEINK